MQTSSRANVCIVIAMTLNNRISRRVGLVMIMKVTPVKFTVREDDFNDDLGDPHGLRSTLMQELAKEVIGESDGIHFCTDNEV